MGSTIQRGNVAEKQAMTLLQKDDWNVIRSPRTMRCIGPGRFISQANDFWALYDLIAKKDGETLWIQVKLGPKNISGAKKEIRVFHNQFMGPTESSEVWQKVSRKGFVKHIYSPDVDRWIKELINLKGERI